MSAVVALDVPVSGSAVASLDVSGNVPPVLPVVAAPLVVGVPAVPAELEPGGSVLALLVSAVVTSVVGIVVFSLAPQLTAPQPRWTRMTRRELRCVRIRRSYHGARRP